MTSKPFTKTVTNYVSATILSYSTLFSRPVRAEPSRQPQQQEYLVPEKNLETLANKPDWINNTLAIGGLTLLGVGTGIGYSTWQDEKDLQSSCGRTRSGCSEGQVESLQERYMAADYLMVMGVASIAIAAVRGLINDSSPKKERKNNKISLTSQGATIEF